MHRCTPQRVSLPQPQALADFDKAISLAPEAPVPYLNRALAHESLGVQAQLAGRQEEATEQFRLARLVSKCLRTCALCAQADCCWRGGGGLQVNAHGCLDTACLGPE